MNSCDDHTPSAPRSPATVWREEDAHPSLITERTVAVIGYGNQASAQAQNLRDRGVSVLVGLRDPASASGRAAREAGFEVGAIPEQVARAELVAMLIPDSAQPAVFRSLIEPGLQEGAAVLFGHGYNLHYGHISAGAAHDLLLVAPKAPGSEVRRAFRDGSGAPALVGCSQDHSGSGLDLALAYAWGIGATKAGVVATTVREETETDLFGEQAVLIGGACSLMRSAWETLVEAGYGPEVAYYECIQELKMVIDLVAAHGISGMYNHISETARYGGQTRGDMLIDGHVRTQMRRLLDDIRDGSFDHEWGEEVAAGRPRYLAVGKELAAHPAETVGEHLRAAGVLPCDTTITDPTPHSAGSRP